jgi:hypothetical protein
MYIDCRETKSYGGTSCSSKAAGKHLTHPFITVLCFTKIPLPNKDKTKAFDFLSSLEQNLNVSFQAQEEAEARDLGIGLLRTPDELSDGEKGNGSNFIRYSKGTKLLNIIFLKTQT